MRLILKLSGEHPDLPLAELKAVLEGESIGYELHTNGRMVTAEVASEDSSFLSRLSHTLKASEHLSESNSLDTLSCEIYDCISDVSSFRVSSSRQIQQRLGRLLKDMGLKVRLNEPEADIMVIEEDGAYVAGLDIALKRDYEERRPQHREYFHPTSLHPKLARAIVNLCRVKAGDTVLDPFCGTGGILIEAGLMGMQLAGWDVDEAMVDGATRNLAQYNLTGDLKVMDAVKGRMAVDAIATDPPYGRASYATQDTRQLYNKFLDNAQGMLAPGARMCMVLPEKDNIGSEGLRTVESFKIRVHKSLTRHITVFEAI